MKIFASYPTKERKYINGYGYGAYQHVYKDAELQVAKLERRAVGSRGAATKRFYYSAKCVPPSDAEYVFDGLISVAINRSKNTKFRPKDFCFIGDSVCFDVPESD